MQKADVVNRATLSTILSLVCLAAACHAQELLTKNVTRCPTAETIELACPVGNLVKVENVTYGTATSDPATCHPATAAAGNCAYVETERSYGCNGRESCRVRTNATRYYNSMVPRCGQRTAYVQVVYSCVPSSLVVDICAPASQQHSLQGASWGFIGTPAYPKPYANNLTCGYALYGKRIMLYAVVMHLEDEGDCLETSDDLRGVSWCGGRAARVLENEVLTYSDTNVLRLMFSSDSRSTGRSLTADSRGSVWLYFTAEPNVASENHAQSLVIGESRGTVKITAGMSSTRSMASGGRQASVTPSLFKGAAAAASETTTQPSMYAASGLAAEKIVIVNNVVASVGSAPDHTLAITLGVIFGCLSLVLVVITSFYLIKRYKSNYCSRHQRSHSTQRVLLPNVTSELMSNIANETAYLATEKNCDDDNFDWKQNNLSSKCTYKEYAPKVASV